MKAPSAQVVSWVNCPRGLSDAARSIEGRLRDFSERTGSSSAVSLRGNVASSFVIAAIVGSNVSIEPDTIQYSTGLLLALPSGTPIPAVVVEDDGAIALDWTFGRRLAISVSVYANGRIGYAWINDSSSGHAMAKMIRGVVPQSVLEQIREIVDAGVRSG